DGVLDPTEGEVCDDGNTVSGDGCSADCRAACGNGITEGPEECDDGNTVDFDGCSSVCVIELPECGNGVEEPGETCDDGNLVSGDGCGATCISECGVVSSAQVVGTAGGTIVAMEADAAGNVYVLVDQPRGPVTYGST